MTSEALSKMSNEALVEQLLAYKEHYKTLSEEFDEYKASSLEMEQMLERELENAERGRRTAEGERDGARRELERVTTRAEADKREACGIEERLRTDLTTTRADLETVRARVRALEQANDDLERKDRYQEQMLADLTKNLESYIERSTLLESELAENHFQAESAARTREELRQDRPRVAVEPLRMERVAPQHTPEETPEEERKAFAAMHIDDTMEVDEAHPSTSSMECVQHLQQLPPTPVSQEGGDSTAAVEEEKPRRAFTHSINKIVKELLVRVDRVESILTTIKTGGSASSTMPLSGAPAGGR